MKKLAKLVSLIFDPRIEVPFLLILAVVTAYNNGAALLFLSLLMFVDMVLPMMFYLHLWRNNEISDGDVSIRQQRVPLYIFTTVAHLGGVGLAFGFGQLGLMRILIVFWLIALMFTLVTSLWKVSIHSGVNAAMATYVVLVWGFKYLWLFVLVGLVAWSRVVLKKHRLEQVLIGGLLGALGIMGGLSIM